MVNTQSVFERVLGVAEPCSRLLIYTPSATIVRVLTTNFLIAYITSWVLYLSGASEDPRMLLPAWVSISTVHDSPKGQTKGPTRQTDAIIDSDRAVSHHATEDQHQARDERIGERLLHSKLCEFERFALAAAPDAGERSGRATVCNSTKWVGAHCARAKYLNLRI